MATVSRGAKLKERVRKWKRIVARDLDAAQRAERQLNDLRAERKANPSQAAALKVAAQKRVVEGTRAALDRSRNTLAGAELSLANYRQARKPATVSSTGLALIVEFEGVYLRPYNDPVGYCTTGIGHLIAYRNCNATDVAKWTLSNRGAALDLLRRDLEKDYLPQVRQALDGSKVPVTQGMLDASVSLAYNVGTGGFAGSSVVREVRAGNKQAAAQAFRLWVKAGGRTLPGLVRRREAEIRRFMA